MLDMYYFVFYNMLLKPVWPCAGTGPMLRSHCHLNCLVPASITSFDGIARELTEPLVSGILEKCFPSMSASISWSILDECLRTHGSPRRSIHRGITTQAVIPNMHATCSTYPFPHPQTVCHMFPAGRSPSARRDGLQKILHVVKDHIV